jgi:hypothetical protein
MSDYHIRQDQQNQNVTEVLRGWRELDRAALDERVLALQRLATRQHLTVDQWRAIDRMRARVKKLRAEGWP